MIINTHTHLNYDKFDDDINDVLLRAKEQQVLSIVVGFDLDSSKKAVEIATTYDHVFAAVGIHPSDVNTSKLEDLNEIESLLSHEKVIAIGETGLDYYHTREFVDLQLVYFNKQIELARKYSLPLIVHSRDASQDTFDILKKNSDINAVLHCYSGSVELAQQYTKLGFYISLAGVVTFKNAKVAKDVAREIDINYLLVETDCPFLSPVPFRGKRNETSYVKYVVEEIASIREKTYEEICDTTTTNAKRLFNINYNF